MSRVGRNPINIPAGVQVSVNDFVVTVTGPKGTLSQSISNNLTVNNENSVLTVVNNAAPKDKKAKAMHGLYRQLIANMITGVSEGYTKTLVCNGIGYKAVQMGKDIELHLGYSHPIMVVAEEGIELSCERTKFENLTATLVYVKGISKEQVGQFASKVRDLRPVEPYHKYGVFYSNEVVRRKEVKSGKK